MALQYITALVVMIIALMPCATQSAGQQSEGVGGGLRNGPGTVIPGCADLVDRQDGISPAQLTFGFFHCGNAYFDKGDFDRAIEDYTQAMRISPQFNAAISNRGSAYLAKHEYDRAIQDFSEAIQIKPGYVTGQVDPLPAFDYATAFQDRGNAYAGEHDYDRAIEDYSEAIRLKLGDAAAFLNRGLAYGMKKNYDKAIADYGEALQIDPKNADAHCFRGTAYFSKHDYDSALRDYNEAIRRQPDDADALYNRGILLNSEGHYGGAVADYNQVLKIDHENAYALYSRGIAEQNGGDLGAATADRAAALKIDPSIADKVGAKEATITPARIDLGQTQFMPPCTALPGGAPPAAQVPPYTEEPIWQLKHMVPGLAGIKPDAGVSGVGSEPARAVQEKTEFILGRTGAVVAGLLHRMPDLIAREEVSQPIASEEIGGKGLDGSILGALRSGSVSMLSGRNAARYETHFFTYRIVRRHDASTGGALDEFRTDARGRPIDSIARHGERPRSVGFATVWLYFFPGNLHESRFRYLGEQWIGNRDTYALAFSQVPGQTGLNAVIESGYGSCSTPLQGVAWVDRSSFQIVRVQTDLVSPLPGIQLNQLRSILNYDAVRIHPLDLELWLPSDVEITWQTAHGYGEELHLYSHYRLFKSTARILPANERPR